MVSCVDVNIAGHEDQCVGFAQDTLNSFTTQCLPCPTANQCFGEDDLDDAVAFPVFTKRSTRRLRRTSIEIYRNSLHNAENVAGEGQCDTVSETRKDETTTADEEMNSTNDDVVCDELVLLSADSNNSMTRPTTAAGNVDMQSHVQLVDITSLSNSNINPKTGILCSYVYIHEVIVINNLNVPVDIKSRWRHNWKSAQVVNSHLVCDPTIRQPGFDFPRQQWSLLNRFRTEQGHCRRKWGLTDTDLCPCGETQTMSHIVESCPLTKLNGGLSRLHCG